MPRKSNEMLALFSLQDTVLSLKGRTAQLKKQPLQFINEISSETYKI